MRSQVVKHADVTLSRSIAVRDGVASGPRCYSLFARAPNALRRQIHTRETHLAALVRDVVIVHDRDTNCTW